MRNWNIVRLTQPVFLSWFLDCLWGIETLSATGSKAGFALVFRLPMRNWNYKGYRLRPYIARAVFRLPMRNWNTGTPCGTVMYLPFLDCLWGIETLPSRGRYILPHRFLDCLWGIETTSINRFNFFLSKFLDCLWGIETFKRQNIPLQALQPHGEDGNRRQTLY